MAALYQQCLVQLKFLYEKMIVGGLAYNVKLQVSL